MITPPPPTVKNVRRARKSEPEPAPVEERAPRGESRLGRAGRALAGVVMVVAIGGSAAWGARRYVTTSPRFAVTEIVTTGQKHRSADELATTAGVKRGDNVFSVDLDAARARLLADPWIQDASLGRQLPGTIFLRVVEREAKGLMSTTGGVAGDTYLVTREGDVIKRLQAGDPTDLPVVTGISADALVDDRDGAARTVRSALDLAFDYEHSPIAERSPLEEVHVEPNGDLTLVVGKHAVALHVGAPPYRRKLARAERVLSELHRRGAKPDAIMLDNEARPERVVVRMR